MSAKQASKVKPAQLRDAFKAGLATCWQYARSLHPKETPYAFALHGLEGTPHLYPYVLTEEGLTQVAKRYVANGYHETLAEARKDLRYSMEDSPYSDELEDKLPTVDALMEPLEESLDETEGYASLAKAAMDAFVALDKQGVFGRGRQRENLLLMIDTSLAEKDWSEPSIKRLNSRAAARRYAKETKVEGDYVGAHHFELSGDGHLLCYDSYREVDPRTDKVFDDLVVCDVVGLRLKRRWCISSRSKEGIFLGISCGSDGTVFITETRELGDDYKTRLTSFAKGNKARTKRVELSGEVTTILSSADGTRIFVGLSNEKLHVLDQSLQVLQSHQIPKNVRLERLLKTGEFLGTVKKRLVSLGQDLKVTPLRHPGEAFRVSLDDAERICAISTVGKGGLICDQKPKDQFGFKLLTFPKMKLLHDIRVPAHQLTDANLSSDGKLVACEANECGKYNTTAIVIYDTRTGKEIARRKVERAAGMKFLPSKDVLVMTTSGHMKSEPLLFWKIR